MLVSANEILTGISRRLLQRLMLMLVIVVALRTAGFFMGQSDDGTFRSTTSEMRPDPALSAVDEDSLWNPGSTYPNRPRTDQPGAEDGWGSN